ncbi:hypothetical protein [Streptomyces sp. NPDC016845]|uniref:hypothetical protein n=1 Tax=Streptomyces sp. NPDC016845 TaxID=3364972 RepID=UPI00378A0F58
MVQRPTSPEEFYLGATVLGDHRFVLSEELSTARNACGEEGDLTGDLRFLAETMESVVPLVTRHHRTGTPDGRMTVSRRSVDITDVDLWLLGGRERAQVVVDLRIRPVVGAAGALTGLECEGEARINGMRCGAVSARLAVAQPARRPEGPGARPSHPAADVPRSWPVPRGRAGLRDATVRGPHVVHGRRLLMDVVAGHEGHEAGYRAARSTRRDDLADTALLLEASGQAAIHAVAELRNFTTAHCLPTRWSSLRDAPFDPSLPVQWVAEPGAVHRDAMDRPMVPVAIELAQGERRISTSTMSVLQDC